MKKKLQNRKTFVTFRPLDALMGEGRNREIKIAYKLYKNEKGSNAMKRKKILVLILAALVLTTGGVWAVTAIAAAQTEKPQAEKTCDIADPDYEKNITEEQRVFNELINKQLYKEISKNLEPYATYGLRYDAEENQLYFNETPVCYFADNLAADGTFEGTELKSENGTIGVVAERNKSGTLVGLKQLNAQELNEFLANGWRK